VAHAADSYAAARALDLCAVDAMRLVVLAWPVTMMLNTGWWLCAAGGYAAVL
jgi:hypothetical protein